MHNSNIRLEVIRKQTRQLRRQHRKSEVRPLSEYAIRMQKKLEMISRLTKIVVGKCAKTLEGAMCESFGMYRAETENLIDQNDLRVGESIEENLLLVLCDPKSTASCHINRSTPSAISNRLSGDYERKFVDEVAKVLRLGGTRT